MALDQHDLADLRLIYRVLHAHLMEHAELMDSDFFHALQTFLQSRAKTVGVDLTNHAEWAHWLDTGTK